MKKFFKNNKGFTLVELIIVIAVIAVLSAVAAPQYIKYVERSRQGTDASILQEVKHIVEIEAGTTETLTASKVKVAVAKDATSGKYVGTLTGTASFDSTAATKTAAFTNVENTVGDLTFKSANTVGEYTLDITAEGAVTWDTATNSDDAIAALEKGTKVAAPAAG